MRAQVFLDQGEQRALLIFGELGVGDAFVFLDGRCARVGGERYRRARYVLMIAFGALLGGERLHQRAAEVFFGAEHAGAFHRTVANFRRIRAKELRAAAESGNRLAVHDRPVLRAVMAFVAPAPGAGLGGLSEEGEEVEIGIARGTLALLEFAQHVFELANRFGLAE